MALKIDGKSIHKKDAKKKRLEWASEQFNAVRGGVQGYVCMVPELVDDQRGTLTPSGAAKNTILGAPEPPHFAKKTV